MIELHGSDPFPWKPPGTHTVSAVFQGSRHVGIRPGA